MKVSVLLEISIELCLLTGFRSKNERIWWLLYAFNGYQV